jgi:hypothetical protein
MYSPKGTGTLTRRLTGIGDSVPAANFLSWPLAGHGDAVYTRMASSPSTKHWVSGKPDETLKELLSEMKRCQTQYYSDKNNTAFAAALIQALKNLSDHLRGK